MSFSPNCRFETQLASYQLLIWEPTFRVDTVTNQEHLPSMAALGFVSAVSQTTPLKACWERSDGRSEEDHVVMVHAAGLTELSRPCVDWVERAGAACAPICVGCASVWSWSMRLSKCSAMCPSPPRPTQIPREVKVRAHTSWLFLQLVGSSSLFGERGTMNLC